jgi:lanosterol synthase
MEAWRWEDGDGIRYAGARSHAWDTAFAMRAALDAPAAHRAPEAMLSGYAFLRATQLREDLPGAAEQRREPVRGGFCFSDGRHRWPVSDCTAEALSAILLVHADAALALSGEGRIEDAWLLEAGRFILARQNDDGGFGSYERRRAGSLLEALNPSEMFGSCMTERSYIECTASCVGALARLAATGAAGGERARMQDAVRRGVGCLLRAQRPDGSWSAFWGIGHTYAIFHVVEALHAAGTRGDDPAVRRSVRWLYDHQKADGGWGEHWRSCLEDGYVEHPESQAVQTAWALLALLAAGESADDPRLKRAASLLASRQRADGSWPDEAPAGVFFGTAVLDYRLYKDYFPAWALGRLLTRRG